MQVRRATSDDAEPLAGLLAEYLAESYGGEGGMTPAELRRDVLGERPRHHVLLAEAGRRAVGFISWDPVYELQWAVGGARVADFYVVPAHRGYGTALALVAALAAEVSAGGGTFLRAEAHPRTSTRRSFARAAVVKPGGETYLANRAFRRVAELAGRPVRDLFRGLPPVEWNDQP